MAAPSSPPYTIEQYLLDRALIEDTIKTMYRLYDERRTSLLSKTVFAETVHVDYTSLLGSEPYTVSGAEYEKNLEHILGGIRKNQHAVT
jgi:SnoaL-like domain